MPIVVESKIRSSPAFMCFIILLSFLCFAVLYRSYMHHQEIFCQVLDLRDAVLVCFVVVSVIVLSSIFHLLLLFGFEYFLSWQSSSIINQFWNHLAVQVRLHIFICLNIVGCVYFAWLYLHKELKLHWDYFLVTFCISILLSCITILFDYDDVELSSSQNMEKSIGAYWANGAHSVFYKEILFDITKRISDFEKKKGITLLVKKLVIICPLSCNASGTLEGMDGAMEVIGKLKKIIVDEGGANNRCFKTNVYKIRGPPETYIAAVTPSPLATLYEMRGIMDPVILEYHRVCFIQTLRELTRSENCIILEYDDINSPEQLHSFLLSKLEDKKFISVIK